MWGIKGGLLGDGTCMLRFKGQEKLRQEYIEVFLRWGNPCTPLVHSGLSSRPSLFPPIQGGTSLHSLFSALPLSLSKMKLSLTLHPLSCLSLSL